MYNIIKLIISLCLIATLNQTQAKKRKSKSYKVTPNLQFEPGFSTNPAQIPEDELSSSFIKVSPEVYFEYAIKKSKHFLFTNLKLDYHKYADELVDGVKNRTALQFDIGNTYFVTPRHEFGLTASGSFEKSASLNFTPAGALDTEGRDVEFTQGFFEAYYSYNREKFDVEASVGFIQRTHDSLVQDDVIGADGLFAEFKDDFSQLSYKLSLNYRATPNTTFTLEPSVSQRSYDERSARDTVGTTNQGVNELLDELHIGASLGFEYDDDFIKYKIKGSFNNEEDTIFKAHNAQSFGIAAEFEIPVAKLFIFNAKYSWSQKDYEFFVNNPQQAPDSGDLRADNDQSMAITLSKQIQKLMIDLKYQNIKRDSTYRPFDSSIGSVYDENIISLNLKYKF